MNVNRSLLYPACLFGLSVMSLGCARTKQNVTDHIDRLTNKIHRLEEDNLQLRQDLIDCRQETKTLREKKESDGPGISLPAEPKPPNVTVPGMSSSEESPVEPELVTTDQGPGVSPVTTVAPPANPGSNPGSNSEINPRVEQLYLHPHATGGFDSDGRPGDEGLSVLIEPRNAAGQYVPLAAPVSVALLDPALRGKPEAVVGRWKFTAKEVEQMIHDSPSGRGIYVKVPWRAKRPDHPKLALFVQYQTVDGRKIETRREIFIRLPGQVATGWTRRLNDPQVQNPPVNPQVQNPPVNVARQRHPDQVIVRPAETKRPRWRPTRD